MPRAEPHRILRARGARGRRVRHPGRRRERGRAAIPGRRRHHRVPRRRPRSTRSRRSRLAAARRSGAQRRDERKRGSVLATLRLEHHRGPVAEAVRRPSGARTRHVPMTPVHADLDAAHALIDAHLWGPVRTQPSVQHVEYDPELRRWYLRFGCDGRDAATIYFGLHQRTLRYELSFLPPPADGARRAELHEWLLRRNHELYAARFSLGRDGDVYLTGRVALEH